MAKKYIATSVEKKWTSGTDKKNFQSIQNVGMEQNMMGQH